MKLGRDVSQLQVRVAVAVSATPLFWSAGIVPVMVAAVVVACRHVAIPFVAGVDGVLVMLVLVVSDVVHTRLVTFGVTAGVVHPLDIVPFPPN